MCFICEFKSDLPNAIRYNAPEYTKKEVYAACCRVLGILKACSSNGFEIRASIDSSKFHNHAKSKRNEISVDVPYILIVGERGPEAVAIQFFLGAHNGIYIVSTVNSAGMVDMFHSSDPTATPLITIQAWIDEGNCERLEEDCGKRIFLYCHYTDADLDADWELRASMCFTEALRAASEQIHDGAKHRAMAVRKNLKHKKIQRKRQNLSSSCHRSPHFVARHILTDDPE